MPKGLILNVDTTKSEFQNPMVELRQGDGNYQSLYVTVTDNGDPFDLTGWTVSFMGTSAGSHKIIDANVVLDSTVVGAFNYTPTKAWGQDEGEFKNAYFKFVKSDETASGASFRVNVLNAVDLTDEEAGDYISVVDALIEQVKTDMDNKLADTQKRLSDTQSQANTVQTNVDDLNTNVNELKEQNNNLLTADNTWSGNNTFSKPINGTIMRGSILDGYDLNGYQFLGDWVINGANNLVNYPSGAINYGYLHVEYINPTTAIQTIRTTDSSTYIRFLAGSTPVWSAWQKTAIDGNVVHNTGNEKVAGNKTFTGANTFSGINNFNVAQNFNGGVIGLGYSSLLNTGNGLSVVPAGARQTTDGGQSWHSLANDDSVVHLAGTETIEGWKTFSGNNTFTGSNSFNGITVLAQSATVEFPMWYGSKMKVTRFGNLVTLNYSVSPSQDIPSGVNSTQTIPSGFRPSFSVYMANGAGSGGAVQVNTDGTLTSKGGISVAFPYAYTSVYFTSDAFPTS